MVEKPPFARQLVSIPASDKGISGPILITTVDAEESFDWGLPLSRAPASVAAMRHQHRAHKVFARYGIRPIYLVDYPVAMQDGGRSPLRELLADGMCEIGTQLHPWVNPPFVENISIRNSFAGNLPAELEREKIQTLTKVIEDSFDIVPRVYRAGRYGFGPHTPDALKALGYHVDTSMVPCWSFTAEGGPDYREMTASPFWMDQERRLLEIPISAALVGAAAKWDWRGARYVFDGFAQTAHLPAVLARLGVLQRIKLTPEGIAIGEAKKLVRHMVAEGHKIFLLTYHSPSLEPGNTPYVRTADDLRRFLAWLDEFYDFFALEIGGKYVSWRVAYASLSDVRQPGAPVSTSGNSGPGVGNSESVIVPSMTLSAATPLPKAFDDTRANQSSPSPQRPKSENEIPSEDITTGPGVLLLAFYYPPENVSGAARPHRMARYLRQSGYRVHVVAGNPPGIEDSSEDVVRVPSSEGTTRGARLLSGIAEGVERCAMPYNDRLPWLPHAFAAAARSLRSAPRQVVLSTQPPSVTHLAALLLKWRFGMPWIADFRDPLWGNPFRTGRRAAVLDPMLERLIFKNADAVVGNTDSVAEMWRSRYPKWASKIRVIWNGFDPDEKISPLPLKQRVRRLIVHVGTLYGPRTPDLLVQSLDRLMASGRISPGSFELRQVGPVENACFDPKNPIVSRLTSMDCLHVKSRMLPKAQAQQEMLDADYLLLLDMTQGKNAGLQVPAKVFEYIRACRPILAFTSRGSATEQVLRNSGIRYACVDPGAAPSKVDEMVMTFLTAPACETTPGPGFWRDFDARQQAVDLMDIISRIWLASDRSRTRKRGAAAR